MTEEQQQQQQEILVSNFGFIFRYRIVVIPSTASLPSTAASTRGLVRHTVSPVSVVVRCCSRSLAVMSAYSWIVSVLLLKILYCANLHLSI